MITSGMPPNVIGNVYSDFCQINIKKRVLVRFMEIVQLLAASEQMPQPPRMLN